MTLHDADTPIRMSRVLRASPATVFQALIRPELLQRWMCPENFSVAVVEADPRPGGRFRIAMRRPDGDIHPACGTYTEVRAPEVLAFTWRWENDHALAGIETNIPHRAQRARRTHLPADVPFRFADRRPAHRPPGRLDRRIDEPRTALRAREHIMSAANAEASIVNVHLAQRDVTLLAVSRAPLADIERFRRAPGHAWTRK